MTSPRWLPGSLALLLAALAPLVLAGPAQARSCNGSILQGAVGAKSSDTPTYGTKGKIWVKNFDHHQYQTWRPVAVVQNENNFVEVGWITTDFYDQKAHPFKTWVNNGEAASIVYDGQDITPRDAFHTFTVMDRDDNNEYAFFVDGEELGLKAHVSINANLSKPWAESERLCTGDSLWAQFRNLQYLRAGGDFRDWQETINHVNVFKSPYQYCPVSDNEFDVKQSC